MFDQMVDCINQNDYRLHPLGMSTHHASVSDATHTHTAHTNPRSAQVWTCC
jgi:hypothetical protein